MQVQVCVCVSMLSSSRMQAQSELLGWLHNNMHACMDWEPGKLLYDTWTMTAIHRLCRARILNSIEAQC